MAMKPNFLTSMGYHIFLTMVLRARAPSARAELRYKQRITLLEEENKALQTRLENSQAEIEDLRALFDGVNLKQEAANTSCERVEHELKELHRRHVKP